LHIRPSGRPCKNPAVTRLRLRGPGRERRRHAPEPVQ
jgi:hypothetical protein